MPKAEKLLKDVLQNEPSNIAALEILGLIKASQGLHAEAANYLKKLPDRLTTPLFDIEIFTGNIEKAYQVMRQKHEDKQAPQSLEI